MLLLKQPKTSFSAALFLQNLVFFSGIPLRCMSTTPAFSHSRASIVEMLKRARNFLVRLNLIIEQVDYQVVHLEYLNTLDHPADLCTKTLPLRQLKSFVAIC